MIPLLVLLLAALHTDPLPDGKTIDSVTFSFTGSGPFGGPMTHLGFSIDGKFRYSHETDSHTSSGGKVTSVEWTIPKREVVILFHKLVEDGLLDLPEPIFLKPGDVTHFLVSSGRWQITLVADPVPAKLLAHLRPYLDKINPPAQPCKPSGAPKTAKTVLTHLRYSFTEKLDGPEATLTVARDGAVTYSRKTHPTTPGGSKVLANKSWTIPSDDAAKLLDALTADGLFDLTDTGGQKFPNHYLQATAGKWKTTSFPKEMTDAVMKHLRPLLVKGEPAFWKK